MACYQNKCDVAMLGDQALLQDDPIRGYQLEASRGSVVSRHGDVFQIRLEGFADQLLTVDLQTKTLDYRQTFVTGAKRTGRGNCTRSTIEVAR